MMTLRHAILMVGVGSIGERHLRCFAATGRCEVALCEINPRLREEVAARYGVSRVYGSLDEALKERFDGAVIATPAHTHIPIARRLAEAGLHILIEKPLGVSDEGVEALERLVEARGVVAGVAYVWRAHPVVAAMKRALDEGRFGRPVELTIAAGQHFPTYRPAYREIYYARREHGGGAIQDALTHMLDLGQWLVGPIDRLVADAAHQVLEGVEVEDTVHVLARHGGGVREVMAGYTLNQHQAPNETTITICCEGGTCRSLVHENRWQWMTRPGESWREEPLPAFERDSLFERQADAFLDAMEGKGAPLCTLCEGRRTLWANLAALRSAQDESRFINLTSVEGVGGVESAT